MDILQHFVPRPAALYSSGVSGLIEVDREVAGEWGFPWATRLLGEAWLGPIGSEKIVVEVKERCWDRRLLRAFWLGPESSANREGVWEQRSSPV